MKLIDHVLKATDKSVKTIREKATDNCSIHRAANYNKITILTSFNSSR